MQIPSTISSFSPFLRAIISSSQRENVVNWIFILQNVHTIHKWPRYSIWPGVYYIYAMKWIKPRHSVADALCTGKGRKILPSIKCPRKNYDCQHMRQTKTIAIKCNIFSMSYITNSNNKHHQFAHKTVENWETAIIHVQSSDRTKYSFYARREKNPERKHIALCRTN